jgi:hypothetical protein
LIHFGQLASGKFLPAGADWRVVAEAAEEKLDFGERETHFGRETDEENTAEGMVGVAALSAFAFGRREEAALFVIADGGGVEVGGAGELADFHLWCSFLEPEADDRRTAASSIVTSRKSGGPSKLRVNKHAALQSGREKRRPLQISLTTLDLKLSLSSSIWGWDVANPNWRKAMKNGKEKFLAAGKKSAAGVTLAVWMSSSGALALGAQEPAFIVKPERQVETVQSKYYCNIKALTPEERKGHEKLTEKLMTERKEIVETAKGYEFQFSPKNVSLAELADWVGAESKCCPFFDFHIDLETQGNLLCLRLTGDEGIKAFIRAEFKIENAK